MNGCIFSDISRKEAGTRLLIYIPCFKSMFSEFKAKKIFKK
jgi:hypothetical protein